jgi:hypothetical protein
MKYLKPFIESSLNLNDYKYRKEVLPDEIDDILLPLRDELILYKITFPTSDLKKIEIDIQHQYDKLINREVIKETFSHLLSYLRSEGFEVSYYWTESESSDITTPEKFSFEDFFRLIPDYFSQMYLSFLYE